MEIKSEYDFEYKHNKAIIPGESDSSSKSDSVDTIKSPSKLTILIIVTVLAGAFSLYLAVLEPDRFGAYHDDGIYVSTARALAEGEGYKIISLPYEPAQTKYPPFYPFMLSLIWKAYPQFPENITLMMMLSVLATLGFLAMTWRYLVRQGYATNRQALLIVGLTALNWRTMILATSIYSEMVYALIAVSGLYLAEKYEKEKSGWVAGVALGVVIGLGSLTRSSGAALLIAVAAYFLLKRRWRGLMPIAVGAVFLLGWVGWSYASRTTAEGVNVAYYTSYLGHLNGVISDLQAHNNASRFMTILSIIFQNIIGGILISIPLVCSGLNYEWIPSLGGYSLIMALCFLFFVFILFVTGYLRDISKRVRLLHLYVLSSLGLYLFWLPGISYDRFLMPMLPFLLLPIIMELGRMASLARKEFAKDSTIVQRLSAALIGLVLLMISSITLYNYGWGVYRTLASLEKSNVRASEDAEAIAWINAHAEPSDVLVCYRDPMYFLYTGRKATRSLPMQGMISWEDAGAATSRFSELFIRMIGEIKEGYIVLTSSDFELEDQPEHHRETLSNLIEQHPEKFAPVFESTDGRSRIFRIENNER